MAAQYYKINYKSDFVLTINSDAGWAVPFCIKFWTGMPSHGYFAGFDGENYVNCRVGETPTQLLVMFDDHHMPIGPLRMQIAYHTTIEEFPDRKFDEVTNPINVTVDIDGTEYQVMLDFTGETGAEIDFSMPSSGVMSVNGKIGYVTLTAEDVGAQPNIEDLATIRSGAAEGATAVQPAEMTAALATKQDTIPDLANIRSGAAAGATAVQPAALQEGLATKQNVISDLATIRSGAAAGATAVQPAAITPIQTALQTIEAVIPSAATAQNQLADKNFVNSSIATNTANFVGTYNSLAELQAVQNPTNNDYGFVIETDAQGNEYYDRYKYVAASQQWLFEYKVESTPFTADQWAAIQSGITSALVTKLNALPTNAELQQTLDGKANTSDIPTALSQLSQDSTHRVVTDAEKSTWNGKQNAIDDLATIRSGAAAGATAVQPAAMNTALAAKQDTLTFDNTPTANSSNPVKSSGIKTALDAKQSTISTVNVTVDNNTGTPSGSASVSGSTLSLSFQNLKGATGATGATGPQGPQGERGLPGESGVTGDVSGFTVIQTIDPSATYGATDIAGAATVQATNQELTELEGEVGTIEITNVSGFSTGNYIKNNQGVGQSCPMTEATAATQDCIKIDAKAGEKYRIVGVGASSGRLWATVNKSTSKIIAAAEANGNTLETPSDVTLTMEQDCWLVCNVYNATSSPAYKNTAETPYSITKYSPKSTSRIDKIYNELGYENRQLDLIRKDNWYYSSDNPAIREYTDYYLKYAYVKSGVKLHITATNSASKTLRYGFLQTVPAIGSSVQNIVAIIGTVADRYIEMPYDGYIVFEAYTGYFEDLVVEGYYSKMVDSLTETLYGEKREITKTLSWSDGYVNSFLYPKEIRSSTLSKFTQPFMLYAGETVEVETDTTKTGVICTTYANSLAVGDMVASMIAYTGETSEYHKFTYTATEDTKIMLSNKNSYVSRVKFYIYNKKPIDVEVEELEDRVTALEGGGVGLYKEKDNLIYTAAEHSAFNCLFFSDIHADSDRMEVIKSIANKWSARLNCVINGGDTVENNAASGALDWYNDIASAITVDVLTCVGNHDFKNSSGYGYISLSDTYNLIIQPMIDRGVTGLNIDTGKLRYYKDYGSIRVVVIDAIKGSGSTIPFSSEYDSKYFMNGGKAWLDGVLADAITNSKSVIIVNHSPFPSAKAKYKWNSLSEFVAAKPNSFLSYHPTVTPGYNLDLMPLELGAMESVKTFEDNGGEFICWLTGHVHIDHFLDVTDHTTYGYQPLVNIATASSTATGAEHDMSRDKVKDCVDYFSVNTTLKTFSIIRLGVNMDGLLRKKNVLSYDYVGHQIIDNY